MYFFWTSADKPLFHGSAGNTGGTLAAKKKRSEWPEFLFFNDGNDAAVLFWFYSISLYSNISS